MLKLQRAFLCSYASVTIRLAEVLRQPPFMAVLYAREDKGDAAGWTDPLDLRAKVVRRTRGFGTSTTFPICGERGGLPRRGRPIPPGSLAEQAARYGTARYVHDGGCAAIARPVFWKGKLVKVVVVAVPRKRLRRPRDPRWSPRTCLGAGAGWWRRRQVPGRSCRPVS